MECSHSPRDNFVCSTVVMAIAGVVLVVFLSVFRITVSSGTLNGLICYGYLIPVPVPSIPSFTYLYLG